MVCSLLLLDRKLSPKLKLSESEAVNVKYRWENQAIKIKKPKLSLFDEFF